MAISEKQRFSFGPFELDVHSAELYKAGSKLKVQPQPIQILAVLLEHPGELVTREELQKRIWPSDTFVDFEHGLNTAVKKLRQALGDESETPRFIETLPRRGYRFVGSLGSGDTETNRALSRSPEPITSNTVAVQHRLRWESRNNRAQAKRIVIAAALTLTLLTGISGLYWISFRAAPRVIDVQPLIRQKGLQLGGHIATDGIRVYYHEIQPQKGSFLSQVSTDGGESSHVGALWQGVGIRDVSLRGTELLMTSCCPPMTRIVSLPGGSARPVLIPTEARWILWAPNDSGYIYALNGDKDFYFSDKNGEHQTKLASVPDITSPRISPKGDVIRWTVQDPGAVNEDIWEMGVDGSNPHPVFPNMRGQTGYGNWTADGKLFYFLRRNGTTKTLWAVSEGRRTLSFRSRSPELLYAGPLELSYPISSRRSKEIFATGRLLQAELSVLDHQNFIPYLNGVSACFVTFSPDRQWIAYSSYPDGALWKSRIDGSEKTQLTSPPMVTILPRWSPDGKFIAFSVWNLGDHHSIYLISAEGGQPRLLLTGPSEPSDPTWSPDSKLIVYAENVGKVHISILDLDSMTSTAVRGSEGMWSPRWSPDGRFIVAHNGFGGEGGHGDVMLYSFTEHEWRPLFSGNPPAWEAWSHDSRYVYASIGELIVRAEITTGKIETVLNTHGLTWTAVSMPYWFDLTPDDRIMILQRQDNQNIYALRLEY